MMQTLRWFCAVAMVAAALPTVAQLEVHWGLAHPQDKASMPVSRAATVFPQRAARTPAVAELREQTPGVFCLASGWEMAEEGKVTAAPTSLFSEAFDTSEWYNAVVPGTVLTTLVEQGVFPDPYYGLNNLAIPDSLCRMDWWYRIVFEVPVAMRSKTVELIFEGINYRARVWLNGKQVERIDGAFTRGVFDVTDHLKAEGRNVLAVRISPPPNPGIPNEQSVIAGQGLNGGVLTQDGPTFIATEGWDWVPGIRDRNSGIWQPVRLRFTNGIRIGDPQVITDLPLPDTTRVAVSVRADIHNLTAVAKKTTVRGRIVDIVFEKEVTVPAKSKVRVDFRPADFPQLELRNPRLWWPNTYGAQAMYDLTLEATTGAGAVSHSEKVRFGVREFSYELAMDMPAGEDMRVTYSPIDALKNGKPIIDNLRRRKRADGVWVPSLRAGADPALFTPSPDPAMGAFLVIRVNGRRVYCKGGNWGMDDAMKKSSREHLEPYFRLHRDANLNMVRNWTGESTEKTFYELCDEYGMLVFNDFWLSTESYNLDVADDDLFLANARDVVRRFRNHPSIVVWNPRNEGFAPPYIEERLGAMIACEDGTRHYQPNSQHLNLGKSGPWRYLKDQSVYYTQYAKGFNTEMGLPSVPVAESMREMMDPADLWPVGDVWAYHDLHQGEKRYINDYMEVINRKYGAPSGYEDLCRKAQMLNYDSHRTLFEAWNGRMWNNTSGFLLWMTHPAWPSTVWQIYSWDYETHGSYFGTMKACEPVHIQVDMPDNAVVAVNTTVRDIPQAVVTRTLYDFAGKRLSETEKKVDISAGATRRCFVAEHPTDLPQVYLERLELRDTKGMLLSRNDYWRTAGDADFRIFDTAGKAQVRCRATTIGNGTMRVELDNRSRMPAVALKLNARDPRSGKRILPAYFSEGYFNLLPGEKRIVTAHCDTAFPLSVTIEGYNVERIAAEIK